MNSISGRSPKQNWTRVYTILGLKNCKLSIGTHLKFAINECINTNTFPDILKEAYETPIYKKGD